MTARGPAGAPERVGVRIDALAAGGDGVGRDPAGRAVFVARTAPGDQVVARVVEPHARWARAELVELTTPGPGRVEPPCPRFADATCGGCQWQHVDRAGQEAAKQALVAGALRRLVARGLALRPLVAPVAPWGWRRRARWTARGGAVGHHAPRGHAVCDLEACPQLEPALEAVLAAVRAAGALRGDGLVHAAVGAGAHVVLDAPCDPVRARALVGRAGIAGVTWRAPGGEAGHAGAPAIELEPGLQARGDDFAQASRAGNDALRAVVAEAVAPLRRGLRVLELHAGSGNFTRDLVAAGAAVTASDGRAPLAPPAGLAGELLLGDDAAVVGRLAAAGARFDLVLLDPPRTGARAAVAALPALGPDRVVYVSCDPATLARDGELLAAAGLAPRWAQALDLMPQTAHVEVVACFERQ